MKDEYIREKDVLDKIDKDGSYYAARSLLINKARFDTEADLREWAKTNDLKIEEILEKKTVFYLLSKRSG